MKAAPSTDIRDAPAYTFLAAARYLGMPQATLRYWVLGRTDRRAAGSVVSEPLIRAPAGSGSLISFNNLVEAHVLRALRTKDGVRMAVIRKAIGYAENALGIERLLLSDELRTSGQDVFDRDADALPFRLYPLRPAWSGDKKTIVIDPRISFGRPTVAGSGISTAALVDRFDAGEDLRTLAKDYRLDIAQIEDAVLYEWAA